MLDTILDTVVPASEKLRALARSNLVFRYFSQTGLHHFEDKSSATDEGG